MTETTFAQDSNIRIESASISLWELFIIFLKIGSLAFGGFMALISVVENNIVKKRKLVSHQDMLDAISLANLLPGPMAVNVVTYAGYRIRGKSGALVAATAVILPSFILILSLSYMYFNYGEMANFKNVFQGFMPAVAAIIVSVVWRLGKKTITGKTEIIFFILAVFALSLAPLEYKIFTPIILIGITGFLGYFIFNQKKSSAVKIKKTIPRKKIITTILFFFALVILWFIPLPYEKNSLIYLTLTFASMSLMLFGGGYVFIPIIGSIVVLQNGWLTTQEFADAIALGQITPGPILISATFIGYKVAGFWGALFSTIAIFGTSAIFMVTVSQWYEFIRDSSATQAVMHGIHCSVIGMIFVAAIVILQASFQHPILSFGLSWPIYSIFILSLVAILKFNLDVIWIIPPAGLLGYLLF